MQWISSPLTTSSLPSRRPDARGVLPPLPLLPLLPALFLACASTPSPELAGQAAAPAGPVISRLVPDHGPAGEAYPIRVVIEGERFAAEANVVRFGPITLDSLPSTDGGTRITFFAPKAMPPVGEVAPPPLGPGTYDVTVTTSEGTSLPAVFTLDRLGR